MTTLQSPPRLIAKKKELPAPIPVLPDPVAVVEQVIAEEKAQKPTKPIRPMPYLTVATIVCENLGVTIEDCAGPTRHERVTLARELTTVLCREFTTLSYPEIARSMGKPNHSTVITAKQRYEKTKEDMLEWNYIHFAKWQWANLIRSQLLERLDPRPM